MEKDLKQSAVMDPQIETINKLKEAIYRKRPILQKILERQGSVSLSAYAETYAIHPMAKKFNPLLRQEFISEVALFTKELLGEKTAESVRRQLDEYYYVSTADHLGPLSHPFFVHANILTALPHMVRPSPDHGQVIVLACGNVSLGNSSLPRTILFHDPVSTEIGYEKIHLFPASERNAPVSRHLPFTKKTITTILASIQKKYSEQLARKLTTLIDAVYGRFDVLSSRYFSEQITKTNADLWKRFFSKSDVVVPELVYLELEEIVSRLLIKHHLFSKTEISQMLFENSIQEKVLTSFDTIPGAFSVAEKKGTFLFWLLAKDGKSRVALWKKGNALVSLDDAYQIALTSETIGSYLKDGTLIPSIMLSLVTIACYYGVKCLGGFSQTTYLTEMLTAYKKIFPESDIMQIATDDAFTETLASDFIIGLVDIHGQMLPATGLDFVLYNERGSWDAFKKTADAVSLEEALSLMLPELYTMLYSEHERDPELLAITRDDISSVIGVGAKMTPCLVAR